MTIPFKFPPCGGGRRGRSPFRPSVGPRSNVESLEGRALLSAYVTASDAPIYHGPKPPHPGPILNEIGVGYAVKSPRFYNQYTGPIQANLNAAGMKATYDAAGNLILTGIVAGAMDPTAANGNQYYMFLINHGSSAAIAPFPGRPNIKYDAYVAVDITPAGVGAEVVDLATGTATPLSTTTSVLIQTTLPNAGIAQDFKVFIPAGTPGIAPGAGGLNATVTFAGLAADPLANPFTPPNPVDVASFAPEGRGVLIAGAPGRPTPHHLR